MRSRAKKRLRVAAILTASLLIVEIVGGILSNSLALLSDAGHMFTDFLALVLILISIHWAAKPATAEKTYGYYRVEILAALINGSILFFVAIQILWEAWQRFFLNELVDFAIMFPVSIAGLVVNAFSVALLYRHTDHLATRSAFFHVLGDTISSVGVVIAALVIRWTGWYAIDTIASVFIAAMIIFGAYHLVRESVDILLEATPRGISLPQVKERILQVKGVEGVHDLHVWTISSGFHAASAHVVARHMDLRASKMLIEKVSQVLNEHYSISHTTLQVVPAADPAQIQKL